MRNKTLLLVLVPGGSLQFASVAQATHFTGWYVGLEFGGNWIANTNVSNDTIDPIWGGGFPPTVAKFDTGGAALGTLGWSWPSFRAELELGYRWNDLNDFVVTGGHFQGGGKFNELSHMLNLLWNPAISDNIDLSLGGGLGGDYIRYKNDSGFHTVPIHDHDCVFAWQLMAGLSYHLPPSYDLFVNYRYFNADSPEFTEFDGANLHNDTYGTVQKHTLTVGIRFH